MNVDAVGTFLIQLLSSVMMVGIIWFVQIVHYPLFSLIKEGFTAYEKMHMRRTSYVVGPIMLIEMVSAIFLVGQLESAFLSRLASLNLVILVLIWLSTLLFQVFQHQKLSVRFTHQAHNRLVHSNWLRTIFWTIKSAVLCWMLLYVLY